MTNIERAYRWNDIIMRLYDIEFNTANSLIKRFYARKYEGFAAEMCRMYCDKAALANE